MDQTTTLNKKYTSSLSDKEDSSNLLIQSRKLKDRLFKIAAMVFSFITIGMEMRTTSRLV